MRMNTHERTITEGLNNDQERMGIKAKVYWVMTAVLLIVLAAATSWIGDQWARTLTRAAVAMMVAISIKEFWVCVPTVGRVKGAGAR